MKSKEYGHKHYIEHKDSYAKQGREWRETHRKVCACGDSMDHRSATCRKCSSRQNGKNTAGSKSGELAKRWKGGRYIHNGYVMLYMPDYHRTTTRGKYILEHVYVWEQGNSKHLPHGWHIHHLNGVKDDNRLINLIALSSRKHVLVLQAKAKRIQALEALLSNQHQLL